MTRQNYTLGSRIECPLDCNTSHAVLFGRDTVHPFPGFNGELFSICASIAARSHERSYRLVWSFGRSVSDCDAENAYSVWHEQLIKQTGATRNKANDN